MGFDHVIANMFFLPAAIFAGIDITWAQAGWNFIWSFLGNLVGAAVFVGGAYYFLYGGDDTPRGDGATTQPAGERGRGPGAAPGRRSDLALARELDLGRTRG